MWVVQNATFLTCCSVGPLFIIFYRPKRREFRTLTWQTGACRDIKQYSYNTYLHHSRIIPHHFNGDSIICDCFSMHLSYFTIFYHWLLVILYYLTLFYIIFILYYIMLYYAILYYITLCLWLMWLICIYHLYRHLRHRWPWPSLRPPVSAAPRHCAARASPCCAARRSSRRPSSRRRSARPRQSCGGCRKPPRSRGKAENSGFHPGNTKGKPWKVMEKP